MRSKAEVVRAIRARVYVDNDSAKTARLARLAIAGVLLVPWVPIALYFLHTLAR